MTERRVVVTGMGAITPIGNTVPAYWESLQQGVSGADAITLFDASKFKTQFACEVKDFDAKDYIPRQEARKMDRFSHFAVVAAEEAIQDSGLDFQQEDPYRTGVVIGSGIGGLETFRDEVMGFGSGDGTPRFNPFFIPKMIVDIAPGHVSMRHNLKGPNYSCVSACATGTNSIIDAWMLIKMGFADIMVSGGSEAAINEPGVGGFNALKALSEQNDDPKTASRPFDLDRNGFVLGEGAGVLILEEYEHAKARGAKIYAELKSVGLSADAYHITAPDPEGKGATEVMRQCIQRAGIEPTAIDHINMHGTSTGLGDIAETKAIKQSFGQHAYSISINSTKSMTGHLLGAAGAIEAIASILALHHGLIPPTINHFTDDPECDLDYTFNTARQRSIQYALSNTFGFGGHNASLLFSKLN
ncbi:MAG: beta-ketoacyl-ACP synthase II [Bacteroidetes bacterium]|jgi:3-oxoacyl-[acyl-carrier-protein] synthase II|nr:beta-ketoacyl-ACP synthase II [Bacteroidota bacterium]